MKVTITCDVDFTPEEGQEGTDVQYAVEMWFKEQVGTYMEVLHQDAAGDSQKLGDVYIDEDPATWSVKVGA